MSYSNTNHKWGQPCDLPAEVQTAQHPLAVGITSNTSESS